MGSYVSGCTSRRRTGFLLPAFPGCDLTGAHVFPPLPPHLGDPVVHPPVREDGRVVVLEDLEVRAVDEVVRHDERVALGAPG